MEDEIEVIELSKNVFEQTKRDNYKTTKIRWKLGPQGEQIMIQKQIKRYDGVITIESGDFDSNLKCLVKGDRIITRSTSDYHPLSFFTKEEEKGEIVTVESGNFDPSSDCFVKGKKITTKTKPYYYTKEEEKTVTVESGDFDLTSGCLRRGDREKTYTGYYPSTEEKENGQFDERGDLTDGKRLKVIMSNKYHDEKTISEDIKKRGNLTDVKKITTTKEDSRTTVIEEKKTFDERSDLVKGYEIKTEERKESGGKRNFTITERNGEFRSDHLTKGVRTIKYVTKYTADYIDTFEYRSEYETECKGKLPKDSIVEVIESGSYNNGEYFYRPEELSAGTRTTTSTHNGEITEVIVQEGEFYGPSGDFKKGKMTKKTTDSTNTKNEETIIEFFGGPDHTKKCIKRKIVEREKKKAKDKQNVDGAVISTTAYSEEKNLDKSGGLEIGYEEENVVWSNGGHSFSRLEGSFNHSNRLVDGRIESKEIKFEGEIKTITNYSEDCKNGETDKSLKTMEKIGPAIESFITKGKTRIGSGYDNFLVETKETTTEVGPNGEKVTAYKVETQRPCSDCLHTKGHREIEKHDGEKITKSVEDGEYTHIYLDTGSRTIRETGPGYEIITNEKGKFVTFSEKNHLNKGDKITTRINNNGEKTIITEKGNFVEGGLFSHKEMGKRTTIGPNGEITEEEGYFSNMFFDSENHFHFIPASKLEYGTKTVTRPNGGDRTIYDGYFVEDDLIDGNEITESNNGTVKTKREVHGDAEAERNRRYKQQRKNNLQNKQSTSTSKMRGFIEKSKRLFTTLTKGLDALNIFQGNNSMEQQLGEGEEEDIYTGI
ncbi:MAG: hypothetical protein LBI29_01325 [Rickettsiales bacterium]|jgi:hypothetical protein|nr:hypothetical protein [Rickettsiales bacterium]